MIDSICDDDIDVCGSSYMIFLMGSMESKMSTVCISEIMREYIAHEKGPRIISIHFSSLVIVNPDWRKGAVSGHTWTMAGCHICGAVRTILGDLDELASLSTSFA
jgi:hypothetical protein